MCGVWDGGGGDGALKGGCELFPCVMIFVEDFIYDRFAVIVWLLAGVSGSAIGIGVGGSYN